jgi:polysaccharide chain length determinant protein (PEP-CTERM system associated)
MQELVQQILWTARGMWKFRWPGLIVTWLVAVALVVVIWRIPDQYEAAARVYVDTDSILRPLMSGLAVQPNVDQQIAMLSRTLISRPNLEKLVRMANLDPKDQSQAGQEALIERLQKYIEIRTAGGVNLYKMAFRDPDPDQAQRVIESLVSIFVESGLAASRKDTDSAKNFLNEQIKVFESQLEEAELRLKEFRLRNIDRQVGSADGKDVATRLSEIGGQLDAARLQLREAERSRDSAKRQLTELRAQNQGSAVTSLLRESTVAVSTQELDSRIDAQKRNLDQLLQRFTEQHPDVVSTRRLIADLEDQRKKEVIELQKKAALNAQYAPSPTAATESLAQQELNRMLAGAEVQVAAMQARVDEYAGRYAQTKEQLKTAPQIEAEASQLNRDYAVTRKNYEDLVARRQSAVMSGELDVASGVADFRLIDPPRVAPKPVSPNRVLLLAGALVVALAAGLFTAFAAARLRPTFGDAHELRLRTGLPLLGVVTLLTTEADRQRERMRLLRFAGASGSLLLLMMTGLVLVFLMNQ